MTVDPMVRRSPTGHLQAWNRYVYGDNSPLKYLDPDGREVVVADSLALQLIRETVPAELRTRIRTDDSGVVDAKALGSNNSNKNLKALAELVSMSQSTVVRTGSGAGDDLNFYFESVESIVEKFPDVKGQIDRPDLYLGQFDPPEESASGKATVIVSDGNGEASTAPRLELVVTMAHELYGHALLFAKGKPYQHGDKSVDTAITEVESRTRKQ